MRVLVVEDDALVQALLARVLESRGHEVTTCDSAEEASEQLEKDAFPLILLDWMLPQKDGLTLCRELRGMSHGRHSVVVVVTSRRSPEDLQAILDAGADDYLPKPIDIFHLQVRLAIAERLARGANSRRRELKQLASTQRWLSELVQRVPVGIIVADLEGRVQKLVGRVLQNSRNKLGQPIESLFEPHPHLARHISMAYSGSNVQTQLKLEDRAVKVDWLPNRDPEGNSDGVVGVLVLQGIEVPPNPPLSHGLIYRGRAMRAVIDQIADVAKLDWTVLIEGETGTGKELVARAIHESSPRAGKPFIAINCATLSETLLQSQLFGHKRGAFTGAVSDHVGLFEAAAGGSLFLDEIGDISLGVQASLLRVLETWEITRLGETQPRRVDVRVICATNQDLGKAVGRGEFRADLLYRIRVGRISLPPLRQRTEDLPLLIAHFVEGVAKETGKPITGCTDKAMARLIAHEWPGNVRELKGALEYAAIHCRLGSIDTDDLPPEFSGSNEEEAVQSITREVVLGVLEQAKGNRTRAAQILGVSRATFYRYLSRFDIS